MKKINVRLDCYRAFLRLLVEPLLLPRFFSKQRILDGRTGGLFAKVFPSRKIGVPRVWFHAASAGELESLWTVISSWAERPGEIVITVFSHSAEKQLSNLLKETSGKASNILFSGYSPWEGHWQQALQKIQPSAFVTAKYEAWPELWAGLAVDHIPLVIVGAKKRRSLSLVKSLCRLFGAPMPVLKFLTVLPDEGPELMTLFEGAQVEQTGDPRWDRVAQRAQRGSPRAAQLVGAFANAQRPWGVLGSAWMEDLRVWGPNIEKVRGTLWVVPHRVDSEAVSEIETFLGCRGFLVIKTSSLVAGRNGDLPARACLLVDEMGFLSELYSAANWAFVGGGFGQGVHSTIEPAIHGIPVAIGPNGAKKFPEIEELVRSGQVEICSGSDRLGAWLADALVCPESTRTSWKEDVQRRLGATGRVVGVLQSLH